jgi:hypothetical protein
MTTLSTSIKERISLKELFALKGKFVSDKEFIEIISNTGIENVIFLAPLPKLRYATPFGFGLYSHSDLQLVDCKINEERYKLNDRYKLTLQAIENTGLYGSEDYYLSDFFSLIKEGIINIK